MTSATYSDAERDALERVGRWAVLEVLVDPCQAHLSEFDGLVTDGAGDGPDVEVLREAGYTVDDLPPAWESLDDEEGRE